MSEQLKQMREIGFVPLVVLEDEADAVPLATALQRGRHSGGRYGVSN